MLEKPIFASIFIIAVCLTAIEEVFLVTTGYFIYTSNMSGYPNSI